MNVIVATEIQKSDFQDSYLGNQLKFMEGINGLFYISEENCHNPKFSSIKEQLENLPRMDIMLVKSIEIF